MKIWRKSSYSSGNGGDCVELAETRRGPAHIRDSKDPSGPQLVVSRAALRGLLDGIRSGRYTR